MKKIIITALLSSLIAAPTFAATAPDNTAVSIGINYGMESVFGIQGEYNISAVADNAPVSVQVFLKNYSQDISPGVSWDTTGLGAAAIYDFNSVARLDKKIHPYAGIGLMYVSHSWKGAGPSRTYTGVGSGLYLAGGVRYALTSQVAADVNYNVFGDLTVGINYSF